MNKTWSLYKAFSSNLEMPKPNGEKKTKLYNRFGMIAFIGIMVPISVVVGYVTYVLTDLIYMFDGNSYGLLTELDLISAFAMIFGMPLMFSVLFFSSDLQFLTALPISSTSLYTARFWHTFKAENVMTSNVLFAIYIGYFIAVGRNAGLKEALNPISLIASVVGLIGALLLPLIYCSILALLLMLVLRKLNRTDIYYHTSLLLFIGFTVLFLMSFKRYGSINTMNLLDSIVAGDNSFTQLCNYLFPCNYLSTLALRTHSVLPLLFAILILAALFFISLIVAQLTYRKGLFAAAVVSNRKSMRKMASAMKKRSVFSALLTKEIKVLTRTMTYRMNCVYANLLWPIAAVIFISEAPKYEFFKVFAYNLKNGDSNNQVILFAVFIGLAFIASGLNSIASTSFTREGVHIDMLKYIPASLDKQVKAKVFVAVLFTFIPEVIAVIIVAIRFEMYLMLPLYILISFVCVLIATMIGVLMDSISPYTVWSDELSALRGNLNCFFNLAGEMIAALIIGLIAYGINLLLHNSLISVSVITVLLLATGTVLFAVGINKAKRNIEQLK